MKLNLHNVSDEDLLQELNRRNYDAHDIYGMMYQLDAIATANDDDEYGRHGAASDKATEQEVEGGRADVPVSAEFTTV